MSTNDLIQAIHAHFILLMTEIPPFRVVFSTMWCRIPISNLVQFQNLPQKAWNGRWISCLSKPSCGEGSFWKAPDELPKLRMGWLERISHMVRNLQSVFFGSPNDYLGLGRLGKTTPVVSKPSSPPVSLTNGWSHVSHIFNQDGWEEGTLVHPNVDNDNGIWWLLDKIRLLTT